MNSHGVLEWDLVALQQAMKLTPEEVRAYFTDGRRVSFILERRLPREVLDGTLAPSEGAGFDLIDKLVGTTTKISREKALSLLKQIV